MKIYVTAYTNDFIFKEHKIKSIKIDSYGDIIFIDFDDDHILYYDEIGLIDGGGIASCVYSFRKLSESEINKLKLKKIKEKHRNCIKS